MAFIEWTDDLSVGIETIDKQHQRLVEIINELYDAVMQVKGQDAIKKTVNGMIEYTVVHFTTEEDIMQKINYTGYPEHKQEHESFKDKAIDLKNKLENDAFVLSLDILTFLKDWLTHHIKGTDQKYIQTFHDNNIT